MKTDINNRYTMELFSNQENAEKAYEHAISKGYLDDDINVIMSEYSRNKYSDSTLANETTKGLAIGGATGCTIGGIIGALIAAGTSVVIPGLGLIIAGPLALGLTGAGVGSITGGLIGALMGWGIPEDKVKEYDEGIKAGGIILGVNEYLPDSRLHEEWQLYK
jgi:uncharacterized membrane protein